MNKKTVSKRSIWQILTIGIFASLALLIMTGLSRTVKAQTEAPNQIAQSIAYPECPPGSQPTRLQRETSKLNRSLQSNKWWDLYLFFSEEYRPSDNHPNSETLSPECQPMIGDETNQLFLPIIHRKPLSSTCSQSNFGTMLMQNDPSDFIKPIDVLAYANDQYGIKGMASTGSPSEIARDEWYIRLPGWRRGFTRGTYDELGGIHFTATWLGMEDMYECFGYGPESAHQAGDEALDPVFWVPEAEALAHAANKCLNYGPSVQDYERMATPENSTEPRDYLLRLLISQVAPSVDVWTVQVAKYQNWVDTGRDADRNPYSMDDFKVWISKWASWIKNANPNTEVWVQLGIGKFDPAQQVCLPPQPPSYLLAYRETLIEAGVDGIWVMPSMPCQLSTDPQSHDNYLQTLVMFKDAIDLSCGE